MSMSEFISSSANGIAARNRAKNDKKYCENFYKVAPADKKSIFPVEETNLFLTDLVNFYWAEATWDVPAIEYLESLLLKCLIVRVNSIVSS